MSLMEKKLTTRWESRAGTWATYKAPIHAQVRRTALLPMALSIFLAVCLIVPALHAYGRDIPRDNSLSSTLSEKPLNWGQYSPFTPLAAYAPPPADCAVTQVNLIQRHGARYPTSGAAGRILGALEKLMNVTEYSNEKLEFLKTFEYDLGQDDLVPLGAEQ